MNINFKDTQSKIKFEEVKYGELFMYEDTLYVKTGVVPDDYGNEGWNCYAIGSKFGSNYVEDYEEVLSVKSITVKS